MPWKAVKSPLPAGRYLFMGNEAVAEGAIAAGCDYFAGYPITPASEIMEHLCRRFAELPGRAFMQMEDELASMGSLIGAAWAGAKALTATSGPGFSLMLENLGYAIATETPCVVVDVQRIGPSTGQPTRVTQSDVMQARWGASGDYEIIVLSPWSVEEAYHETIRAFNLAERFRLPVVMVLDQEVGHMMEAVKIPQEVKVFDREKAKGVAHFLGGGEVAPMASFGEGESLLVTGSAHDEWGMRQVNSYEVQTRLSQHLLDKVRRYTSEIVETESYYCDDGDLELLFVAYGFTARSALAALREARAEGRKYGLLRLKTLWPFPEEAVREASSRARRVVVPELNLGMMVREVQRIRPDAESITRTDGDILLPAELRAKVLGS